MNWIAQKLFPRRTGHRPSEGMASSGNRGLTAKERSITTAFHKAYYDGWHDGLRTLDLTWFGHQLMKCPLDLWIYQEIVVETEPQFIVETGTNQGGSALFLASLCQLANRGQVVSIDINRLPTFPSHPRLEYLTGSSVAPEIVGQVYAKAQGRRTLVILDSDHSKSHVLAEMQAYHDLVPVGGYLIVEDTNVNGHPVARGHGPGPMEAVQEFLTKNNSFVVDHSRERLMLTMNPSGYLKRIR